MGEVHPDTLAAWDLRAGRVLVGELAVDGLEAGPLEPARVVPVGRQAAADRDLAVVVAESIAAGDVAATLRAAGGDALRSVTLFDIYRGAPLAADDKSLAWRLEMRTGERPLGEGEVEELVARLVEAVATHHGGRLRA